MIETVNMRSLMKTVIYIGSLCTCLQL